jgi:hypothetical protein
MRQVFCGGQKLPEMNFFLTFWSLQRRPKTIGNVRKDFAAAKKLPEKVFFFDLLESQTA